LAIPFVDAKDKDFVPPDRTAQRAAELVEGERWFRDKELVASREVLGLEILEGAAVELVGPGLRDQVDVGGQRLSILGLHNALDGLDFLNSLDAQAINVVEALVHRRGPPFGVGAGVGSIDGDIRAVLSEAVQANAITGIG